MRGLILVNPSAGQDRRLDMTDELRERIDPSTADIEPLPRSGVASRIATAVLDGVRFIGAAGGDGTIRSIAGHLVDGPVPLLAVPGGTRNHFALAVGTGELDRVVAAIEGGRVTRVDVGEIGDEIFLNNASLGAYPHLVGRREQREDRHAKWLATLLATVEELRHGSRAHLSLDGAAPRRVWSLFVGNGEYGTDVADLTSRSSLTGGVLDVAVAIAHGRASRLRIALAIARGQLDEHELIERRTTTRLTVAGRQPGRLAVALDGEVLALAGPLEIRSRPAALPVLVPAVEDGDGDPSAV